jgi:hypothetical protein
MFLSSERVKLGDSYDRVHVMAMFLASLILHLL